ncbi:hypothetical protein NQZ68_027377 [Dissostichus eleginoides]|nr:hypothetical protein NQZ68_027377 [Dissostichus eleginoides]
MFAELLCSAVALVLYVNTLGADFCYDDSQELDGCDELHPAHFSGVTLTQVTLKDAAFLGMERMMIYSAQTVGQGASLLCPTPLKASLEK